MSENEPITNEQKFVVQFIRADNGSRSEPMVIDTPKLRILMEDEAFDDKEDDYVLLVGLLQDEDLHIIQSPLQTVRSCRDRFGRKQETQVRN